MAGFENVIRDLKTLKIQGAEAVARESVKAFLHVLQGSKANNSRELLKELNYARSRLIATRPTEPCMRNSLKFVLERHNNLEDFPALTKGINGNINIALGHFRDAEMKIKKYGSEKIRNGSVIFTHCHSSTVVSILLEAKRKGVRFEVCNTETRPLFQGRKTASELSAAGIKVNHYFDSAARLAIKRADMCMFGTDAVQSDGSVVNKIGTELLCEIAERYDVPTYFCTDSWKFDPKTIYGVDEPIENRNAKEVWDKAPKNVCIHNPAFERVDVHKITGIISELGVFSPEVFVEEVRRTYPTLFR